MPARITADQLLLVGVGPGRDRLGNPRFELDEVLIADGQCASGDKDSPEMGERLARGEIVECGVGEGGATGDLAEHYGNGASGDPVQRGRWTVELSERPTERLELGGPVRRRRRTTCRGGRGDGTYCTVG